MAQNNLSNEPHPDDLLGSYALDALDLVEEAQVEAHLAGCLLCRQTVSRLLQVAAQLGQSVSPSTPSPQLQSRIMEALRQERGQPVPAAAPAQSIRSGFGFGRRMSRVLVLVAGVLILILALSLVYNVSLTRQIEQLEMESVSVSARLFNFSTENAQLLEALRQQEVSSYLMANPASQPMLLEPPPRGRRISRRAPGVRRRPARHIDGGRNATRSRIPGLAASVRRGVANGQSRGRFHRLGRQEPLPSGTPISL